MSRRPVRKGQRRGADQLHIVRDVIRRNHQVLQVLHEIADTLEAAGRPPLQFYLYISAHRAAGDL